MRGCPASAEKNPSGSKIFSWAFLAKPEKFGGWRPGGKTLAAGGKRSGSGDPGAWRYSNFFR